MSPLNSLVGMEQSAAISEEVLPESQKVAQGNSAQPQIEAASHQTTPSPFSSARLEQPSPAEIAHVLADFMSPEGAGSSAKSGVLRQRLVSLGMCRPLCRQLAQDFSIASGVLNLHNKGYEVSSTANHYYNSFVGFLQSFRPKNSPEPVLGQHNPNAHDQV